MTKKSANPQRERMIEDRRVKGRRPKTKYLRAMQERPRGSGEVRDAQS